MSTLTQSGILPVEGGHEIYYACYGSERKPTIVNVHGGPGLKSKEKYARQFDLTRYHVVTFDQRGCGQSRFNNVLDANTLTDLVNDMERLRRHIGVSRWFLNGGSWGATLCLAYAQKYPEQVSGLLLASTFLGDFERMTWLHGAPHQIADELFPKEYATYRTFLDTFGIKNRDDLKKLVSILMSGDLVQGANIVTALTQFERRLYVAHQIRPETLIVTDAIRLTKSIYLHYAYNRFFTSEGQFSQDKNTFSEMPIILVHGEMDYVCPLTDIECFARDKKQLRLVTLHNNGHSFDDAGKKATEEAYAQFLRKYQ